MISEEDLMGFGYYDKQVEQSAEGELFDEVYVELEKARRKFPGDDLTFMAMVEEVGELAKAMLDESRERVREEAIQVIVMAARCVLDGDSSTHSRRLRNGLERLSKVTR